MLSLRRLPEPDFQVRFLSKYTVGIKAQKHDISKIKNKIQRAINNSHWSVKTVYYITLVMPLAMGEFMCSTIINVCDMWVAFIKKIKKT